VVDDVVVRAVRWCLPEPVSPATATTSRMTATTVAVAITAWRRRDHLMACA
jgi:hypothetical protein